MRKELLLILILFQCGQSYGQHDSLLSIWHNTNNADTTRINAMHDVAWDYAFINPDSSILMATEELIFSQKIDLGENVVGAYNTLGVASTLKGEYLDALDYYTKAVKRAKKDSKHSDSKIVEEAKRGMAQTYINRGILYKNQGDYVNALSNQLNSLRIWEELGEKTKMGLAYKNIGNIYKNLRDLDKSLEYYHKDIDIAIETDNKEREASAYSNMGTVYDLKGQEDSSLYYFKKSLALDLELDNLKGISTTYGNIGNLYKDLGDYVKAIDFQKKSLAIDIDSGSKKGEANSYVNLGQYYLELEQYSTAKNYLKKGLSLAIEIRALKEQQYARQWLSDVYKKTGDSKNALLNYEAYISLRDSLASKNTNKEITRAEVRFEFEKQNYADSLIRVLQNEKRILKQNQKDDLKEAEIKEEKRFSFLAIIGSVLLLILLVIVIFQVRRQKRNNIVLNNQKLKIEKSDKEKEVLIREIHHRVKNNLQIISSLLKVEQRKSGSDEVKVVLTNSRQRIEAISFVHEKLYLQSDLTQINLEDYLIDIAENLLLSYDKLTNIKLDVRSNVRDSHADVAVNLGLLTAELITNSIKHGYHEDVENFEIQLHFKKEDGLFSFSYSDNGTGAGNRPDIENPKSFGLKLIRSIIKKMNGNIVDQSELSKGFSLLFKFREDG